MDILTRNVETILPSKEELGKKLKAKKLLRVKHGIDPTGPKIHMGRAVVLWKLREFQEAGHKIVLIFGDFTARIGDPSDKEERRPVLSKEDIEKNAKNYLSQIGRILNTKQIELHFNSEWHDNMSEADLIRLSRLLTVNQMLSRRNFSERFRAQKEIGIDEFLYPLLQGYDSVAIKSDIELGGSDQLFNLKAGRILQEAYEQEPQLIMTTNMLWGLDGRKMSTSWGNVVNITDEPAEMFGKLMSLRDELIPDYLTLATRLSEGEMKRIQGLENPKEKKERLALEVVSLYHGKTAAKKAHKEFERVFSEKKLPTEMLEVRLPKGPHDAIDLLVKTGLASSRSEARRLIGQKGVRIEEDILQSISQPIELRKPIILSKGKRHFVKIVPE